MNIHRVSVGALGILLCSQAFDVLGQESKVTLPEIQVIGEQAVGWSKYPPAKPGALICEPLKAA
ncbi:MAG: hypothetical protein WAT12_01680 [Candidatus Nitrotoga sp.]